MRRYLFIFTLCLCALLPVTAQNTTQVNDIQSLSKADTVQKVVVQGLEGNNTEDYREGVDFDENKLAEVVEQVISSPKFDRQQEGIRNSAILGSMSVFLVPITLFICVLLIVWCSLHYNNIRERRRQEIAWKAAERAGNWDALITTPVPSYQRCKRKAVNNIFMGVIICIMLLLILPEAKHIAYAVGVVIVGVGLKNLYLAHMEQKNNWNEQAKKENLNRKDNLTNSPHDELI